MTPATLVDQMSSAAREKFGNDKRWAAACGLPAETLSRLRKRKSCDLRTLDSLATSVGYALVAVPATAGKETSVFDRAREEELLRLCASGDTDAWAWRRHGDGFFMGGLAVMLASVRGFDRRRYLGLAEELHPGVSQPEVFDLWLQRSPVRPARFLPMLKRLKSIAA